MAGTQTVHRHEPNLNSAARNRSDAVWFIAIIETGRRTKHRPIPRGLIKMTAFKQIIVATTAAFALLAPLAGSAIAKSEHNGFGRGHYSKGPQDHATPIRARGSFYHGKVRTPFIDQRIERQTNRIQRGRYAGRLTRFEALRLKSRLFAIRSAREIARVDGKVTYAERRRLMNLLDRNSSRIKKLARNDNHGRRW
jgi:hypothetical protein